MANEGPTPTPAQTIAEQDEEARIYHRNIRFIADHVEAARAEVEEEMRADHPNYDAIMNSDVCSCGGNCAQHNLDAADETPGILNYKGFCFTFGESE